MKFLPWAQAILISTTVCFYIGGSESTDSQLVIPVQNNGSTSPGCVAGCTFSSRPCHGSLFCPQFCSPDNPPKIPNSFLIPPHRDISDARISAKHQKLELFPSSGALALKKRLDPQSYLPASTQQICGFHTSRAPFLFDALF